jgi:Ca2+-binding RTX toxin-like protein
LLQGTEVLEASLDGSTGRVLLRGRGQEGDLLSFALSPDARRIVFSHSLPIGGEHESRLFVADLGAERWHPLSSQHAVSPDWQPVCTLYGTDRRDVLTGTSNRDVICALGGDDTILASGGDDVIQGGDGNDCLHGGDGSDWLFGGAGDDTLLSRDGARDIAGGGPGRDRRATDSGPTDIQRELEGRTLRSRCPG